MYYNKNVDFVELLWEDFVFQIDNRDHKKQEKTYYHRFTKAIIHHFISKDKSISMRNRIFMHIVSDDSVLEDDEFVHTHEDYVPTDDEDVNDKEFDRINKEMYSDVNVGLKDSEREGKQEEPKYTIVSSDVDALWEFDWKRTLFETMTKTRLFEQNSKHKALYHALMELILKDEDAMDKGVTDKLKKRKPDDDRDEGRPAGLDHGLKRKKTCTETEPSKKAKSTGTFKGTTKPPTPNPESNKGKLFENNPTQKWICDLAKAEKPLKTFDDLMSTPIDFSAFVMNHLQISDLTQDILGPKRQRFHGYASKRVSKHDVYSTKRILVVTNVKVNVWCGYGHLEEIELRRSDLKLYKFKEGDFPRLHLIDIEDMLLLFIQNRLFYLEGDVIVHFTAAFYMFTRRTVIQKRVKDFQLGVESYQKKINISKERTREEDLYQRSPYTTLSYPRGVIYEDKLNRERLM
nr:hypothetical protein [Tanacetum cinerariifolium]